MAESPPPSGAEQFVRELPGRMSLPRPSLQFRHRCWLAFERALDPLAAATRLSEREARANRLVRSLGG